MVFLDSIFVGKFFNQIDRVWKAVLFFMKMGKKEGANFLSRITIVRLATHRHSSLLKAVWSTHVVQQLCCRSSQVSNSDTCFIAILCLRDLRKNPDLQRNPLHHGIS